jgi:hypothetical protein
VYVGRVLLQKTKLVVTAIRFFLNEDGEGGEESESDDEIGNCARSQKGAEAAAALHK